MVFLADVVPMLIHNNFMIIKHYLFDSNSGTHQSEYGQFYVRNDKKDTFLEIFLTIYKKMAFELFWKCGNFR